MSCGTPNASSAYLLDLAAATRSGFDAAARLAGKRDGERVAEQRLRRVAAGGTVAEIAQAFDAYEAVVLDMLEPRSPQGSRMERELVALCWQRARYLRADRPHDAWIAIQQASAVSHGDPLLIVEAIELATADGRATEVPALVQLWKTVENTAARQAIVSRWSALAFSGERQRQEEWRELVRVTHAAVPGWIVGVAVAECEVLAKPRDAVVREHLAEQYLGAARAAARGTWVGEGGQADPVAAAMLYVQAADVYAHYLLDPDEESAHSALDEARELGPGSSGVVEAAIELEDRHG